MVAILKQHIGLRAHRRLSPPARSFWPSPSLPGCAKKAGGAGGGFAMPPTPVETATVVAALGDRPLRDGRHHRGRRGDHRRGRDRRHGGEPAVPRRATRSRRGGLIAQLDDAQLRAERRPRRGAPRPEPLDLRPREGGRGPGRRRAAGPRRRRRRPEGGGGEPRAGAGAARQDAHHRAVRGHHRRAAREPRRLSSAPATRSPISPRSTEIRVTFSAPERYLGKLAAGRRGARSRTTAYPGYALHGRDRRHRAGPRPRDAQRADRRARARTRTASSAPACRPTSRSCSSERASALTVPSEAVFVRGRTRRSSTW